MASFHSDGKYVYAAEEENKSMVFLSAGPWLDSMLNTDLTDKMCISGKTGMWVTSQSLDYIWSLMPWREFIPDTVYMVKAYS